MLTSETILTFFATCLLLALAPGPDNVFVVTQSALQGRAAGMWVTLGLCTGLLLHTTAVALGVAAIFKSSALAFSVLQYLGVAYLLYLAWQALSAKTDIPGKTNMSAVRRLQLYRRGVIMNITNAKVSLFCLAFLPQFADPVRGPLTLQIFSLGALFIVATLIVFSSFALLTGVFRERFMRSPSIQNALNKVAALVFVSIAIKLATVER